jgi:hypothetical protein
MCSPAGDVEKPQVKQEVKTEQPVMVKRDIVSAPVPGRPIVYNNPSIQIPVRRPSSGPPAPSSGVKPTTPIATPQPTPAQQIRAPPNLQSTPLPQPRSIEQQTDLAYNRFLCRTGEVVWFYRPTTSAWGLGLVVRRWTPKDQSAQRSYLIQPLSHPFESPPQEVVHTDDHVKPWLAWSAPSCTFAYLQQNPQYEYGAVDWQAMASGRYGEGIASVDASILAAKAIDSTYTLFERLKTSKNEKGDEIRSYNGIYLGAEKIWRGEAVRLRIGTTGSDLLVITDIIEQVFRDPGVDQPYSKVVAVGDIYSYATLDAPDSRNPPTPPQQNHNIPSRMAHDMAWRNSYLIPQTRTMAWWKLISPSYKLPLDEIKGRWYETSLVFQEPFTKTVKNGEGGNGIWMNSRGDATAKGKHTGVNQADRIAAFGASVPKGTRLVEGLDPPLQGFGQVQHDSDTIHVNMGGAGGGTATSDPFSIDEFMHVDHLGDDTGMEFGGSNGFTF